MPSAVPVIQRIDASQPEAIIEALKKDGGVIMKNFTTPELVDQVNSETDPYLRKDKPWKVSIPSGFLGSESESNPRDPPITRFPVHDTDTSKLTTPHRAHYFPQRPVVARGWSHALRQSANTGWCIRSSSSSHPISSPRRLTAGTMTSDTSTRSTQSFPAA